MNRKHLYIAAAVALGALLAWLRSRSSAPKSVTGNITLGDAFSVNSSTYTTPSDLLSPETVTIN